MAAKRRSYVTLICAIAMLTPASGLAQQTVYKWVDEDGVVHFGESPPAGVEAERITTAAGPQNVIPATTAPAPTASGPAEQSVPASAKEQPPVAEARLPSEMSQQELDARCDQAREAKIAPLRAAEIESCKQDRRNDPDWCESFNADFGEGGRTVTGAVRPRMFDDLPECVEALNQRNSR